MTSRRALLKSTLLAPLAALVAPLLPSRAASTPKLPKHLVDYLTTFHSSEDWDYHLWDSTNTRWIYSNTKKCWDSQMPPEVEQELLQHPGGWPTDRWASVSRDKK